MTPWLDDGDVVLHHGDALEQLRLMPSESVQCIVTSPPFWGLRDYSCEGQIGLEETPDEWCAKLVAVMREARRVLRNDGVCWIEIGDTYNGSSSQGGASAKQISNPGSYATNEPGVFRDAGVRRVPDLKHKDLVGAPWLLAFALRADGWYLRSDTIWSRPNPMPESVTDRPTKAHSYVFLLTKSARYFYDADAIREANTSDREPSRKAKPNGAGHLESQRSGVGTPYDGTGTHRNARSVWTISTEPTPFAHFATFPQALVERCIKAGTSEHGCCSECGAPWRRITERATPADEQTERQKVLARIQVERTGGTSSGGQASTTFGLTAAEMPTRSTVGWEPTCRSYPFIDKREAALHGVGIQPCVVLDPFSGSATTALVARRLGRHAIGIELNLDYLRISATRLQQLSLLGGHT